MAGPPAPFDEDVVAAVADEHGMPVTALSDLLARLQALFAHGDRTVEDTVYEWRTGLQGDHLVARTGTTVYLDAPDHAWADLLDWLDLAPADDAAAALRAAHARQLAADRDERVDGAVVVARSR